MIHDFIRLLYPRRCAGCGELVSDNELICAECSSLFREIEPPFCIKCGRHIEDGAQTVCRECLPKGHCYSYGVAAYMYDEAMKKSIARFKFDGWRDNADYYCEGMYRLLGDRIRSFGPQVLIPVPQHRSRTSERGFNQAELLADGLAKRLGIFSVSGYLKRTRPTGYQKRLSRTERIGNLETAFACDEYSEQAELMFGNKKRVMLVDDIYTTGSTMQNCALALKKAGVLNVGIISLSIGNSD